MNPSMVYSLWSILAFLYFDFLKEANSIVIIRKNKTNPVVVKDKYPAFDIPTGKVKDSQRLLLCPAFTPAEKNLNEAFSISGKSLFTVDRIDYSPNTRLNICPDPIEPSIIYNLIDQTYEIGYELYIEERIPALNKNFHYYAPVQGNNEIINSTKPTKDEQFHLHTLKNEYEDGEWTVIKISEEPNRPRIFHWKCELYFKYREFDKLTQREISIGDVSDVDIIYKCPEDSFDDSRHVYSADNQEHCLLDIDTSDSPPKTPNENETLQQNPNQPLAHYFEKSQIIPSWYLHTSWGKLASCMGMNVVPIWKTIADDRLKKVDLYILSAEYQLRLNPNYKIAPTIFGVRGVLNLPTKTDPYGRRDVYLWDFRDQKAQKIPAPKIIYRIFTLESIDYGQYSVAIIIHNTITSVPDSERICTVGSQPSGWSKIENKDTRFGLTYVCPLTTEVAFKLGGFEGITMFSQERSLNLDAIPNRERGLRSSEWYESNASSESYESSRLSESDESYESSSKVPVTPKTRNEMLKIDEEFERLLRLG